MTQPLDSDSTELEEAIAAASRRLEEAAGSSQPAGGAAIDFGELGRADDAQLFCANHPSVPTVLRCNRCGKPICTRCAVQTPVGYRCRQCVGRQQAVYYTGGAGDYVLAALVALLLGGIASLLMALVRSWFIALILGPTIGVGIAEAVRLAVRRRRSRYLWLATLGGFVLGTVPALILALGRVNLFTLLALGLFVVLAVGAAAARLR